MKVLKRAAFVAASTVSFASASPAQAYPIDCAILLCLSGGWPSSAECTKARTVFIRRITPFPVEPPLQIWRCPMGSAFNIPTKGQVEEELFLASVSSESLEPNSGRIADIDVSGPEFDFIRSIKVYHVKNFTTSMHDKSNGKSRCEKEPGPISIGSYDFAGGFSWTRARLSDLPSFAKPTLKCPNTGRFRAVSVEWKDYMGNKGYEVVRY